MNAKLIRLLTILCVLLLAAIVAEWFNAKRIEKQTLAELKVVNKKPAQVVTMPTIALTRKPEPSFADMVDRPLFIKGRRPVPELPPEIQKAAAKPTGPFNWQLNGVYTKDAQFHALLSRAVRLPKGNFTKLGKGGVIDGWTLTEVQKDKVVLNQDGMTKELLLRKPKPKNAVPNNAALNNPRMTPEQAQQMRQPNQPIEPVPEPMPVPDDQMVPDQDFIPNPEDEVVPEPEPEPMAEPEPGFQTDEFNQDANTFENGGNAQF